MVKLAIAAIGISLLILGAGFNLGPARSLTPDISVIGEPPVEAAGWTCGIEGPIYKRIRVCRPILEGGYGP